MNGMNCIISLGGGESYRHQAPGWLLHNISRRVSLLPQVTWMKPALNPRSA